MGRPFEVSGGKAGQCKWPSVLSDGEFFPHTKEDSIKVTSLCEYLELIYPLHYRANKAESVPLLATPQEVKAKYGKQRRKQLNAILDTYSFFPKHYYRGQFTGTPQDPWLLNAKLARDRTISILEPIHNLRGAELQSSLVERIRRYAEHFASSVTLRTPPDNFLSWLTVAQHYGVPSYLMDWTLNPLAGLFFAIDDVYSKPERELMDGEVWCMDIPPKQARVNHHTLVHIKSKSMWQHYLQRQSEVESAEGRTIDNFDEARDVDYPLTIVPELLTRRIDSQSGRFVYFSIEGDMYNWSLKHSNRAWHTLKRICIIPKKHKRKIAQELVTFRIHPGTIWADMEGYAKFISWGGI